MNKTNYTIHKESKTIVVERTFDASIDLVWLAWTDSSILEKWWAPLPWKAETKSMNFSEGGQWLYVMVGPAGEKHWSMVDYKRIVPKQYFTGQDCFCDENGTRNMELPSTHWKNEFTPQNNSTKVTTTLTYESVEALETIINMGFKEGFAMAHDNLDAYIAAQLSLWGQAKPNNAARVSTYLNFPGNTETAMLFYRSVFGTEFIAPGIQRFGDIPQTEGNPPIADNVKHMVLHVELPILGGHILMATDAPKEMGMNLDRGNNMHICLEPDTRAEAKRLFDGLSQNGTITMPLEDMFFGAYFGELVDQFGINWMVNYMEKK